MSKFFKALEQAERERAERERALRDQVVYQEPKASDHDRVVPSQEAKVPEREQVVQQGARVPEREQVVHREAKVSERVPVRPLVSPQDVLAPPPIVERSQIRLVTQDEPGSLSAESYRVLRTNLCHARSDSLLRRVLITSAGVNEGKSTTAANLGIVLAQSEQRVLLVDADLRRPRLHTLFDQPVAPGLASYLAGDSSLATVIHKTSVPNLAIVASGGSPANPAELLSSRRMRQFLDAVGEQYDVVLLDSAPIIGVADARALAPMVDGILVVVRVGKVSRDTLRQARESLEAVQGRILGAVVNRLDGASAPYPKLGSSH